MTSDRKPPILSDDQVSVTTGEASSSNPPSYPNTSTVTFVRLYLTMEGVVKQIHDPADMRDAIKEAQRQGGMLKVTKRLYTGTDKGSFDPRIFSRNWDVFELTEEVRELKREMVRQTQVFGQLMEKQTQALERMLYLMETQRDP